MNLVDAIILVLLMVGILDGFRQGAIRSIVGFFGSLIVFFLSWVLKSSLANVLIGALPQIGGNSAISVIIYYILSFIILLIVFGLIFEVVLKITNVVEKIMDATVILGFISRIIGGVFGLIKMYIFVFIALFILSTFNFSAFNNSKVNHFILDKTPLLGPVISDGWNAIKGVYEASNAEEGLRVLFEKEIINEENFNKLIGR